MAEITDADIAETLRAAGIDPSASGRPGRSLSTTDDIAATLKAAGIDATVTDKGVSFGKSGAEGGFDDTPEQRAALRNRRAVQRTTPRTGPGFPGKEEPEPPQEVKDLADRRGVIAQTVSSIPIAGPLIDRAGAAGAAAIKDEPGTTFGQRYTGYLDQSRAADKWFAHENPMQSLIANTTGAVMGYGPLAATRLGGVALGARGPTLGSRLWTGIPGNSALSATDAGLRDNNIIEGGIIGAAGGAAGPAIGQVARGVTNLATNYLWPRAGLDKFSTGAINKLTGALSGETPASIAAGADRMGPHGFLGDVNKGFTDIAGGLADIPGSNKTVVREAYRLRDAAARDRITAAVDKAAGPPTDPVAWEKMTTEARSKAADPLYTKFRSTVIAPTPEIQALVPRLEEAGAFKMAQRFSAIKGEPIDMKFLGPDGSIVRSPTAQTWDYIKRGLDASIDAAYSGGNKAEGSLLLGLKRDMLKEIEAAPGGSVYKQARQTFADHSALLDARTAGRDTLLGSRSGMSKYELADEWKTLSAPEKKARTMGLRDAIDEAMGDTLHGDTTMRNKLLAPNNQDKIRLMLGDTEANDLIKSLRSEKFLKEQSQDVVHGSQTTPKRERVDALTPKPLPEWNLDLTKPGTYLPPSWVHEMRPSTVLDAWRGVHSADTMNQLAGAVTMPAGPQMNDLIAALHAEAARNTRRLGAANVFDNLIGTTGTGTASTGYRRRRAMSEDERR